MGNPYPAFCRRYGTEDCVLRCRHFMLDELYFCRAYNMKAFGKPVIEVEVKPKKSKASWWDRQAEARNGMQG